ncbi:MAG: transposase [Planctomycetota bacterium]|jgi:REP element-mobilizing transposase RayT
MIAYMLTWTTYGTWLQGHERGYVKDAKHYDANLGLYHQNQMSLKQPPVLLSDVQRERVKMQIIHEAERIDQKIYALTVQDKHVHLVIEKTLETIEAAVHRYKRMATYMLRQNGFEGKVWASHV